MGYYDIKYKGHSISIFLILMSVFLNFIFLIPAFSQSRIVHGTVVDNVTKDPIIGANIVVKGEVERGTITDINGEFYLQASSNERLCVSYIGYITSEVLASKTELLVVLKEDSETLEEVVVVGYGTQKKATLTGAVSAVTSKEMLVTKNENVVNMLTGKIPGVRISQRSSQPGEYDNAIDIRGMGDPLIVVDGIPRDKAYFSRMDVNEIESVSVLKDASAAIYGVRAANGVILVTSKHGNASDGKFDITLSANYGWQQFLHVPETANAVDHMLIINEKKYNDFNKNYPIRTIAPYTWEEMMEYSRGIKKSTNWADELFDNNVPQEQYNLGINGGTEKVKYFFNLGYMKQNGSYKSGSLNYNRWNFRSNVEAQISNRLKASIQLSGYMDEKNQPNTELWTVYKKAWTYRPTSQAWIDGDHTLPAYDDQMLEAENPVASTDSRFTGYNRYKQVNFNGALSLVYDIPGLKGLSARVFYSYDYSNSNNVFYKKEYQLYGKDPNGKLISFQRNTDANLRRSTDPSYGTVMQVSVNYANRFGSHNIGGMLLFEEQYNNWDNFYAQRNMLLDGEYLIYGEDDEQIGSMTGAGDKTRQAIVGKVNYDYKGKYIADFSFRYDASSSFPKGSRWGFFPAISVGWRISEEAFIKELIPFLSNMKLRVSYGEMGDDAGAGTYPQTLVAYSIDKDRVGYYFNGSFVAGVIPTGIPNPSLTWYTAKTYNLGLDFDFWHQKLSGTIEFFKRKRSGLFATSATIIPGTVGANMPLENLNSDETFGWEISLGHRSKVRGIEYWINGQISATKNRWDKFNDVLAGNSMQNWYRGNVSGRNKDIWFAYEEGGRFSNYEEIRYHSTIGANYGQGTLPGDYWYEDWNGDGVVDANDMHPVASYNLPVFNYGLALGAMWKGFDLSMNWQGAAGVYGYYTIVFGDVGPLNDAAVLDMYKDRWHTVNVGDDPWNPHTKWVEGWYPPTGHSFNTGSTGIRNTSYLRLKTLEIGYTLPKVWLKKFTIKDVRLYVNAYNLLTFTGLKNMDPERPGEVGGASVNSVSSYNYPVNRTYNIGATIKF